MLRTFFGTLCFLFVLAHFNYEKKLMLCFSVLLISLIVGGDTRFSSYSARVLFYHLVAALLVARKKE